MYIVIMSGTPTPACRLRKDWRKNENERWIYREVELITFFLNRLSHIHILRVSYKINQIFVINRRGIYLITNSCSLCSCRICCGWTVGHCLCPVPSYSTLVPSTNRCCGRTTCTFALKRCRPMTQSQQYRSNCVLFGVVRLQIWVSSTTNWIPIGQYWVRSPWKCWPKSCPSCCKVF